MSVPAPTPAGPVEDEAVRTLSAGGPDWFPDLEPGRFDVRLTARDDRPRCLLLRYALDGPTVRHEVLVKARRASARQAPGTRPRLALDVAEDPERQARTELQGLSAIAAALSGRDPQRFGVVRPLGLLPGHAALVMDFVPAPTLRSVLLRAAARRTRVHDDVWHNAGGWLAAYQRGARVDGLPTRLGTRQELADLVDRYVDHLDAHTGGRGRVLRQAAQRAVATLPDRLPVAPLHHDFAPRNLLVGPGSRVTVLDPMMSARAPVHEDVGRFLVALRANGVQLASQGLALPRSHLDRYERAFLDGYAGGGGDVGPALPVLHAVVVLDAWAALVTPGNERSWLRTRLVRSSSRRLGSLARRLLEPYA